MYSKSICLKKLCFGLIVLLGSLGGAIAQEANHWVFGDGVHIEFTGSGISFISGSSLSSSEGCTSVSDASGNLLFYSDGSTVWDATDAAMPNGSGLLGSSTSTQSAIAVPNPANSDQYFLFTADQTTGINYSVVDMTLGSNGDIVSSQKNINIVLAADATERLTAVCKGGGEFWVITVNRDNDWLAFDVTTSGVSAVPVTTLVSTLGFSTSSLTDSYVGYLKASPDGSRVCKANRLGSAVFAELADFDISTGAFSAGRQITNNRSGYGVEFSPDGSRLYVATFRRVYQYDPSATTSAALTSSGNLIFTSTTTNDDERVGALQLAPDGQIYVSNGHNSTGGPSMDVIQDPNLAWPLCIYSDNAVTFPAGSESLMGLPDFPNCVAAPASDPCDFNVDVSLSVSDCEYSFVDNSTGGTGVSIVGRLWLFGDGQSSTLQNPTHYYQSNGSYEVCLILMGYNGEECCTDTFCNVIDVECESVPCDAELSITETHNADCEYEFTASVGAYSGGQIFGYHWDFGDGTTGTGATASHSYTTAGVYEVCVTLFLLGPDGCCSITECIEIEVDCEKGSPQPLEQGSDQGKDDAPIDELPENSFTLYPNPAENDVNLSLTVWESTPVLVTLTNMEGKQVRTLMDRDLKKGHYQLNYAIDDLDNGVYIVRCLIGNKVESSRVVVSH